MKRRPEVTRRAGALVFVFVFAALAFATSCGGGRTPSAKSGKPERIISLTPSTTEILYGVGAFGRVVAVSDYCTYPSEAAKLPRVGGWNNPNMEQIAGLRPDLVIFSDQQAQFVGDTARRFAELIHPEAFEKK
jgi:iron complex transport system substrate-binding protein